jgi:hypothetical protein
MNWASFRETAPELARIFEQRLAQTGLGLLGTIRADGWPRISPIEVYIVEGELMLGMMWQSTKAHDLLRDSRATLMTPQCDKEATQGDLKLYGTVADVAEPALRASYGNLLEATINWRPKEPYHLFRLDIQRAGFISFGKEHRLLRWTRDGGVEQLRHPDDA